MANFNGVYSAELTMNGGKLCKRGKLTLRLDGNELKGTMFPTMFWLDSPFRSGKVDGNHFSFTVHWSTPCQQYSMDIEGTLDGDKISGTAKAPIGTYTLTAVRDA